MWGEVAFSVGPFTPSSYRSDVPTCARAEVEAESVAFVGLSASGAATGAYSFPYVAHWSGGDPAKVLETAERVQRAARTILDRLEGVPA